MIEIADMEKKLAEFRIAGENFLGAKELRVSTDNEWVALVSDMKMSGGSANDAIAEVLNTKRGKEVSDLTRVRHRDEAAALTRYNVAVFEFNLANVRAQAVILEEQQKLKSQ